MKELLRVDAVEGGPVYVPVEQIHSIMPHPNRPEYTYLVWSEGGQSSHCTIGVDVDEFAQQLERACSMIRLHTVA